MQAGRLRNMVTIQQPAERRNSFGEMLVDWEDYVTRWGAVEPMLGQEFFTADQFQSDVNTRIRLRYWADHGLTPKMRVCWDDRYFLIETVQEVRSQRRELVLMCREEQ